MLRITATAAGRQPVAANSDGLAFGAAVFARVLLLPIGRERMHFGEVAERAGACNVFGRNAKPPVLVSGCFATETEAFVDECRCEILGDLLVDNVDVASVHQLRPCRLAVARASRQGPDDFNEGQGRLFAEFGNLLVSDHSI